MNVIAFAQHYVAIKIRKEFGKLSKHGRSIAQELDLKPEVKKSLSNLYDNCIPTVQNAILVCNQSLAHSLVSWLLVGRVSLSLAPTGVVTCPDPFQKRSGNTAYNAVF